MIPTPPLVTEETLRFSLRNVQTNWGRMDVKAIAVAKKGAWKVPPHILIPLMCSLILNLLNTTKMGVHIPDDDFESVDILRELEKLEMWCMTVKILL